MFYSGMSCLCFLAALSPSLKISTSQPAVGGKKQTEAFNQILGDIHRAMISQVNHK